MRLFVDTSAFAATVNKQDTHYASAHTFLQAISPEIEWHTSQWVVAETITLLRRRLGFHPAAQFGDTLYQSQLFTIHTVDRPLELTALALFKKFADHPLSFTDCTTVALMQHWKISKIWTFDRDFRDIGLETVPA